MDDQHFLHYFEQAQKNCASYVEEGSSPAPLLALIEEYQNKAAPGSPYSAFFSGEKALYSAEYDNALRYYLQAKGVPHFEFFCYRSSALVAQAHGQNEKTSYFAQKALKIVPNDPFCLKIASQSFALAPASTTTSHQPANDSPFPHYDPSPSLFEQESYPESRSEKTVARSSSESNLEKKIDSYQLQQPLLIKRYLDSLQKRTLPKDHCLYVISGAEAAPEGSSFSEISQLFSHIVPKSSKEAFFLRWNGQGIAINPGKNFLTLLHDQQLHLRDIDAVIVTHESQEIFSSVKEIYDLNYKLNQIASELHIIHYYFNEKSHQQLASQLKPNFKQERSALHCLELFVDSPDIESIELGEGIALHYFPTTFHETFKEKRSNKPSALGIKLELTTKQEGFSHYSTTIHLGYIGSSSWSPLLAHLLGNCELLIAAFGHTSPSDYNKLSYNEDSLGYFGIASLLEEVRPKILLCSEFDGREGDIRIEAVQKLKKESLQHETEGAGTVILPAGGRFHLNLISWQIGCSVTHEAVAPSDIQVVKSLHPFGAIQYLSPDCCL